MPWLYKYTREFFEWQLRPWIIFAACAVPLLASAGVKIGAACRFAESPLHNIVLKDVNLHNEQIDVKTQKFDITFRLDLNIQEN